MKRRPAPLSAEQIVRDYLGRVSTEAQRLLPKGDRLLFVGRTRAAIEAQVGPLASADVEDVLTSLTTLGDPQELVKQERERLYTARRRGAAVQPPALWKPNKPGKPGKPGTQPLPDRSSGRPGSRLPGRQPRKPRPWSARRHGAAPPDTPGPAAAPGQPATTGAEPAPERAEPASTAAGPAVGPADPGTRAAPPRWPGDGEPMAPEPRRAWPRAVPAGTAESAAPAAAAPGSAAPGSAVPETGPSEPGPSASASPGPGPAQPVPSGPVPSEPESVPPEPAPSVPALSEPALSEPAPSEPALSEPALSEPALSEPAQSVPARPLSIVPGMGPPGEGAPPLPGERLPGDRRASPRPLSAAPLAEAWALTRKHPLEAVTVVLLGVGGLLYPFPLWLIAALVGTRSRRWDKRDKWAALAGPPLFALAGLLLLAATRQGSFFSVFFHAARHDFGLLIRVGCVLWAAYLVWRVRRGPRSKPVPPWQRAR